MANVYRSNYNGLQVTLNSRNFHGLSMVAGYTYSHSLDDVGANWDFGYGSGLPQDSYHVGREYANSDFDIRHRFTLSLTYAVPGRKGHAQALEGWEINTIATLESPQYWGPIDLGTDAAGTGPLPVSPPANSPIRWSFHGKPSDFKPTTTGIPFFPGNNSPSAPTDNAACNALAVDGGSPGASTESLAFFGCYAHGNSIMIPPPLGQFGNMGRNIFPDRGFRNLDFSIAFWRTLASTIPRRVLQHLQPSKLREPIRRPKWVRFERSFSAAVRMRMRHARCGSCQSRDRFRREPRRATRIEVYILASTCMVILVAGLNGSLSALHFL